MSKHDLSNGSALDSLRAINVRGAYIDEKGVRWDTNDADFEGYLTKKSKWMGGKCVNLSFLNPSSYL